MRSKKVFVLLLVIILAFSFVSSVYACQDCEPKFSNGFKFEMLDKKSNCDGTYTYKFKITNYNNKAFSYVAIGLPNGVVPLDPLDGSVYQGESGSYIVESPANNPFYSIKYESNGEGFRDGEYDLFEFTVGQQIDYDIVIQAKATNKRGTVTLYCSGSDWSVSQCGCTDIDNDGFSSDGGSCGPVDCNDYDQNVYPGAYEYCNGVDDDCGGNVDEGCCSSYSCLAPDDLGDMTQEDIFLGYSPDIDDLEQLLSESGFSIDVDEDQTNDQVWDADMDSVTLEIELIGKGAAANSNVFGYYLNNDESSFVGLFQMGDHSLYSVPEVSPGDSMTVTIPVNGGVIGFGIDSENPGQTSNNLFVTENLLNPDLQDHAVVYDLCSDEYIIAFEDLLYGSSDIDYEDLVVRVSVIDCSYNPPEPVCGNGEIEEGEQCEPPNTAICDSQCQFKDLTCVEAKNLGLLTGSISGGQATVVNNAYQDYDVGLAVYKKYDDVIDNQELFDYEIGTVGSMDSLDLSVDLPGCRYQIDLFCGDVLLSLDGQRYGSRKIDWEDGYSGTDEYCEADPVCGNGILEDEEECDDGNTVSGDGCSADCVTEYVEPQVYFDDEDTALCQYDPMNITVTGYVDSPSQDVKVVTTYRIVYPDDLRTSENYYSQGILSDGDTFSYDVLWPGIRYFDTIVEIHMGVYMRDLVTNEVIGNTDSLDYYWYPWFCPAPSAPECGNGVVEYGEECDDGNTDNGDGCSSECTVEGGSVCGNGIVEEGEQCDDGNTDNGDGCSSECTIEGGPVCGNGVVESGEQCDDGNTDNGDGCSSECLIEGSDPVCGNGIVEEGEECDDGNTEIGDGCSDICLVEPECGDGICEGDEYLYCPEDCEGNVEPIPEFSTIGMIIGLAVIAGGMLFVLRSRKR